METEKLRAELELAFGRIEALRVMINAVLMTHPRKKAALQLYKELAASQAELLLKEPVSDQFLAGMQDFFGDEALKTLSQGNF